MIKNKHLIFAYFLSFSFLFLPDCGIAQSDINLFDANDKSKEKESSIEQTDSNISFTDIITGKADEKKAQKQNEIDVDASANESWLKGYFKYGKEKFLEKLDTVKDEKDAEKTDLVTVEPKSNAAFFDISNVKLRMSPKEVEEILKKQGYRKISENLEIPNFIEWRSEELCRINGIVGFERLNACATRIAQSNGHQFIEKQLYNRYTTKESIEVTYTSSFTDNLSYRIFYKSSIPFSDSKSSKNIYINNVKVFDFWKRVDLKYGKPDNTTEIKWGMGGKKPYLQAKTGQLELVDPLLVSLDSTRMFNEDSRLANTEYYTF
ncbi:MAG: hypothetical protein IJZ30_07370 [Alphaproteobacteria bacterium]|nr:hypothetical protein [Alphaproteobacteria bacterium]